MKKIFRYFLTAENPVRVNLQRDAARKILSRFSRESLKAKRPEHRFLFSYVIKTNVPEIMETLFLCFVRGMRIILLRKNTASAITEEAGGRVAAGAIASKILNELGISLCAYTKAIGPYVINETEYNYSEISQNSLYMPNNNIAEQAGQYITSLMKETNSCGGVIECIADGLPVGLGEPVFDKLDALLAQAVMSIGAVKGVEIGDGFQAASSVGSKNNDPFYVENGEVHKKTNHSGGTLGGMSDGSRLIVRAAVKPTSSIAIPQETINTAHENTEIVIHGRHDPVIVPRAVVVVEAMTAITLTDLLLQNMTAKMDHLKQIYTKEI